MKPKDKQDNQPETVSPGQVAPEIPPKAENPSSEPDSAPEPQKPGKSKRKKFVITLAAVLLLAAGSAAAYLGIYLPNRPDNVLKQSIVNTLDKDQLSAKGSIAASGGSFGSVSIDYTLQLDTAKGAANITADASLGGAKIPFEGRLVDDSAYVKFDNLDAINSLAKGFLGAQNSKAINDISQKISGKWVEFDKSLLNSGSSCSALNSDNIKLPQDELDQAIDLYLNNEFLAVISTADDNVDGTVTTKFDVGLDQAKLKAFSEEVGKISNSEDCGDNSSQGLQFNANSNTTYDLSMWVNKSKKEIAKIALTAKSEDSGTADIELTFNNDPVDIQKPEDSIPALQLLGDIVQILNQGSPLFQQQNLNIDSNILQL